MKQWLEYLEIGTEIEDFEQIHRNIEKEMVFRGTNLWILVFAIVVASIGLNMNSTAVVIGAMLISPLMGPINGMGYSIATYNYDLFRKALKNFAFAVGAALVASTAYFAMSPVSTAHSELLARTSPTIYDVLIALFGGLAGIVAISSKHKGNVIPGVAIATALMPPLCTAGYGLATAQFNYFFGALYLFTINAVFIGIASMAISQFLKFPIRTLVEPRQKKRVNQYISVVIMITIIPSIYFGYQLVQKEKFTERATRFTRNVGVIEGSYLLRQEINADKKVINLVYGGNLLTPDQKIFLTQRAIEYEIDSNSITIQQGFSINDVNKENENQTDKLNSEINRLASSLTRYQDSTRTKYELGQQLFVELEALYPEVTSLSFSESYIFTDPKNKPPKVNMVYISSNAKELNKVEKEKIEIWLQKRLNTNSLKVYFEN